MTLLFSLGAALSLALLPADGTEAGFKAPAILPGGEGPFDLSGSSMPPEIPGAIIQFNVSAYSVAENAGIVRLNVTRTGNASWASTVQYSTRDGSALAGLNYTAASGTVTFAAGEASKTINITVIDNNVHDAARSFYVNLSGASSADLGTPSSAVVTVAENDAVPVVSFSGSSVQAGEGSGTLALTVSRSRISTYITSVQYAVAGGNATSGTDYSGGSGTLTFAPGATSASITLILLNDNVHEGNETVVVSLSSPANATIGSPSATTVTILNDDAPPALQFGAAQYSANENAGTLTVPVSLAGSTGLPASVSYSVAGGNATAGTDYTGGSGTLTFAPGVTSASITLILLNDNVHEGNETVVISLSSPANATIGSPSTTTVTIRNEDAPPALQFGASAYAAGEGAGKATISVTLSGSTSLVSRVSYSVAGGNATSGTDYSGGSGTLIFNPGVTTASFDVSIVGDAAVEGNETIVLSLSSPGNATIGTRSSTTLTITDDDAAPAPEASFSLVEGWNLISLPLVPQDGSIAALFPADARAGIVNIWGWDEAQQNWIFYSPDPGDYFYQYYPALAGLEAGKAYWVEMNRSATFTVQGTLPGSPAPLVSGWNFVGLTGLTASTPGAIYPDAVDVWGWNPAQQNWMYYSPDPGDYFYQYYPAIDSLQPGQGHWVEMI
jgi:hypothetical protein